MSEKSKQSIMGKKDTEKEEVKNEMAALASPCWLGRIMVYKKEKLMGLWVCLDGDISYEP